MRKPYREPLPLFALPVYASIGGTSYYGPIEY